MCRLWGCKSCADISKSSIPIEQEEPDESDILCEAWSMNKTRSLNREELKMVDILDNDRQAWVVGWTIEVYSKGDKSWHKGKIIQVIGDSKDRKIKVAYGGKTKLISVFSNDVRPLEPESVALTMSFGNILEKANKLLADHKPEIEPVVLDAFISYCENNALDAVGLLYWRLKSRGITIWFDQQQEEISVTSRSKGISKSSCFIIFLTDCYFKGVYTIFELETALALQKEVIIVWEGDERFGGFSNFNFHINACPEKYKAKLFEGEALKFERRKHLEAVQLKILADRIKKQGVQSVHSLKNRSKIKLETSSRATV